MKNKPLNTRRKLLLGLTGGVVATSQLPSTWQKPIVNAVMLPVHAQTTLQEYSGDVSTFQNAGNFDLPSPLSLLIPNAYAGEDVDTAQLHINLTDATNFIATLLIKDDFGNQEIQVAEWLYSGSGTVGGSAIMMGLVNGCPAYFDVTIEVPSAGETASYTITVGELSASGEIGAGGDIPGPAAECPYDDG